MDEHSRDEKRSMVFGFKEFVKKTKNQVLAFMKEEGRVNESLEEGCETNVVKQEQQSRSIEMDHEYQMKEKKQAQVRLRENMGFLRREKDNQEGQVSHKSEYDSNKLQQSSDEEERMWKLVLEDLMEGHEVQDQEMKKHEMVQQEVLIGLKDGLMNKESADKICVNMNKKRKDTSMLEKCEEKPRNGDEETIFLASFKKNEGYVEDQMMLRTCK
ncbi:hypothetical protein KI387_038120, partial [Taxus chinensis]